MDRTGMPASPWCSWLLLGPGRGRRGDERAEGGGSETRHCDDSGERLMRMGFVTMVMTMG